MLQIENLACRRGGSTVFRGLNHGAAAGFVVCVTGANGSGKSSLLRLLAGLIEPAAGRVLWHGANIADDPDTYRQNLHYLGHLDGLKPDLTVREMLHYQHALMGARAACDDRKILEKFGLKNLADRSVARLSAGQKRRLALTRLSVRLAPLWLLDEPTTALDGAGRAFLCDLITGHCATGGMVIAATHDLLDLPHAKIWPMPHSEAR